MPPNNLIHEIAKVGLVLVPMILSLTVHEYAHAWSARKLGDDTAKMMGRLTLNPMAHIDLLGTVILPIFFTLWGGGFFFGWAKPVPINPARFTRRITMRTGMMLTAAAGPLSNLVLATLSVAFMAFAYHQGWLSGLVTTRDLLARLVMVNVSLAVFNLIPVGPLDGQKVVSGFLSGNTALAWERFNQQYGSWLILGVMAFGSRIIAIPFALVLGSLLQLFGLPSSLLF